MQAHFFICTYQHYSLKSSLQYVVMCLEMSLHIILNCILTKNILPAFDFADSKTVLIPLTSCTHLSIRVKAKSILSFLRCYMDEDGMNTLQLDSEELGLIVQKLTVHNQMSSITFDSADFNQWLQILKNFGKIKENQGLLSTSETFQLSSDVLTKGEEPAQELILQFLWDLSSFEKVKGIINDRHSVIVKMLEDLQNHMNSSLQCLAFCALWLLEKSNPLGKPCLFYCMSLQLCP